MQTGLGGDPSSPLPFPAQESPGREVFFVSLREGGSRPLTPHSQQRGQEGAEPGFLGQGGPQWPLQAAPPGRLPAAPQPRASAPTCSPDSSDRLGARAGGRVSQLTRVSAPRRPSWNKVLRPRAGLLPAPDAPRAGSLQTQSEPGSRRESERAGELDESPAQPPLGSLGSLDRPPTCPARPLSAGSGPSARTGHGARSGRSPGPPPLAGAAPARRSAPKRSF